MSHLNGLNGAKPRPNTFKPVLLPRPADTKENAYQTALQLVALIDEHLTAGTQHYHTKSGELLRTLDQVVNAILDDNLVIEATGYGWEENLARAA